MASDIAQQVNERIAFWHQQGVHGAAIYEQLAVDTTLPAIFETREAGAISRDTQAALKQRRQRGDPPAFIRMSGKRVVYPRFEFFMWLRDRYVGRQLEAAE